MAALLPLAVLLPAAAGGGVAAASPAAGYTASYVPAGANSAFVAVDPATDTAYFGAYNAAQVTVIDGATDTVATTIALPGDPRGIAVDPATGTVYVSVLAATTSSQPVVEVIDGATDSVTATIALPVGSYPAGIAVDSSTGTVYVAEYDAAAVAVIDESTNAVTTTVSTGIAAEPFALAVDETTNVVWVADAANDVQSISGTSNSVTQTISPGGGSLEGVAVSRATDTVYAATETGGVAVIDGATGAISKTIAVTEPLFGVAVDPGSGTVFASSTSGIGSTGTTWIIDASSNTITDTIERGGDQVAVDTANDSAYEAADGPAPRAGWVLTPSAANAMSPVITSIPTATLYPSLGPSSFPITGSALPAAITYTETGPLPAGATLSTTGTLSVTPAAGQGGVYPITIIASNGVAPDYSQPFTLTVDTLPTITIPSGTTVHVGTPASIPIDVTAYPPVTSISADYLPPGLTVTQGGPSGWQLVGTPTAGGLYEPELFATNSVGTTGGEVSDIAVLAPPTITSAATTTFSTNARGEEFFINSTGYPAPTFAETGNLPAGVQLLPSGELVGDPPPSAIGQYNFTVTASNSQGTTTQAFTLIVSPPAAVTYADSAIAWTGTAEVITATDSSGNLDYWWQAVTGTWNQQQVAAAGPVTYLNPSIAWTGTAEVITATDSAGDLDYWWQAAGTGTWHEQQVAAASGAVTYADPSIAWTGTAEVITATDSSGNLDYWWQAAGTSTWHQQQVAAGGTVTYASPAITWTGTAEVITATDSSGNLDYWWQAAGTSTWHQQQVAAAGGTVTYASPAIAWTGTAEVIAATDSGGNLDYWWQAAGTAPWNEQQVTSGGVMTSADRAIAWTGTAEVITTIDGGGGVDYWWAAAGSGTWFGFQAVAP